MVRVFFQHVDLLFDLFFLVLGEWEEVSPLLNAPTLHLPCATPYLRDIHDLDGSQLPRLDMPTLWTEMDIQGSGPTFMEGLILGEATPFGFFLS